MNTVDPNIFHHQGRIEFSRQRKIRLITTSWSDNPNKGGEIYKWLDDHLDWNHFDFTFVGRSSIQFERIQMIAPVPSTQVAELLRQHDIFITASQHEACSNSLIEALASHLPALYINSGSNPEIVGEAGLSFSNKEELPDLLNQLVDEYETRQAQITVPKLAEVASRYLAAMGL
jgi:glycosyltransferase involved in cell wall biosynthesis